MDQLFKEDELVLHDKLGVGRVALADGTSVLVEFESGKEELYELGPKKTPPVKVLTLDGYVLPLRKDPAALKELAENDPVALIEKLHTDFGAELSPVLIQRHVAGAAVEDAAWDEWWKKATASLKTDPRFTLDKNLTVHYRGDLSNIAEDLLGTFKRAHNIKEKEKICREILKMEDQGVPVEEAKEAAITFFAGTAAGTTNNIGARLQALSFLKGLDPVQYEFCKRDLDDYVRRLDQQKAADALAGVTDNTIRGQLLTIIEELQPGYIIEIAESLTKRFRKTQRDWILDTLLVHQNTTFIRTLIDSTLADVPTNQQPFIWLACKMIEDPDPLVQLGYDTHDILRRMFKLLLEIHITSAFSSTKDGPSVSREEDELLKMLLKKDAVRTSLKKHTNTTVLLFASMYYENTAIVEEDRQEMLDKLKENYPTLDFTFKNKEVEEGTGEPKLVLTRDTYERYEVELHEIIEQKIPETAQAIKTAREWGDLSENAEYHAAKERQSMLFSRKRQLERILETAGILED